MNWTQVYDPLGAWWLSTLVAALPVVVLLGLLAVFRVKPHWAALAGAMTALVCASWVFGMPWRLSAASLAYGAAFGVLKIAWIVVAAVFLYDVTVYTGQFEIMKSSVAHITEDRRLQALLVAFCFGALIEGAAGFGAPVAIAGAFLIGLGFRPFHAAALNLIANTAPVAWGAIGTPVHTLAAVSGLPEGDLNAMLGRILPITALIVPFWLVRAMVGWRETFEVLPAILVVGVSFALTQFLWSNFVDSNLVDIAGGVVSLAATTIFLRFWKPRRVWRFAEESVDASNEAANEEAIAAPVITQAANETRRAAHVSERRYSKRAMARAWMPFVLLTLFVLLWGLPVIKTAMNRWTTPAFERGGWEVPALHGAVTGAGPGVARPQPEMAKIFWRTLVRMRFAVLAIAFMLGLGFVTRYSGMDAVMGLAFTRTGVLFPFFGTFLGWLGVALTGSDTSSNALFGGLQKITAEQLRLDPVLMCAANSAGGVMGKMVDAQSIVVATAATNQIGNEGRIFRFVLWHSLALGSLVGLIVLAYAYLFAWAVPHGLNFIR